MLMNELNYMPQKYVSELSLIDQHFDNTIKLKQVRHLLEHAVLSQSCQ